MIDNKIHIHLIYLWLGKIIFSMNLILVTFSCQLETDPLEGKTLVVNVRDSINTSTIWNRATIYIIKKNGLVVNDTLIIQSGAIVKFDADSGRSIIVTEKGSITAQGTPSKPVVFTSSLDPRKLSEDDLKTNQTLKAGLWDNIKIYSKLPCSFRLCKFYYGGGGDTKSTIYAAEDVLISINECDFACNDGGNLESGSGVIDLSKALYLSNINRTVFRYNNLPININPNISTNNTNIFHNATDTLGKNKYNIILVKADQPINIKAEWTATDVAYVINGSNLELNSTASFLVGNNVTLKFPLNGQMTLNGPNTIFRNYDGPGVLFTSILDDSSKGDSNADGSKTKPSQEDWKGIKVRESDLFDWGNFKYCTKKED